MAICGGRSSRADAPAGQPAYPEAYADRPILLDAGMTELSLGEEAAWIRNPSESGSIRTLDLSVRHSYGAFELEGDFGQTLGVSARIDTGGIPGVLAFGGEWGGPQPDGSVFTSEFVTIEHKLIVVPHRFALYLNAGTSLSENKTFVIGGELAWTHIFDAYGEALGELQLTPKLAILGSVTANAPLAQSAYPHFYASTGGALEILLALGRWDLFAESSYLSGTSERRVDVELGFRHRWGP